MIKFIILLTVVTITCGFVIDFPSNNGIEVFEVEPVKQIRFSHGKRSRPVIPEAIYLSSAEEAALIAEEKEAEELQDDRRWNGDVMIEGKAAHMDWEKKGLTSVLEEMVKEDVHSWLINYCRMHPRCDIKTLITKLEQNSA